MGAAAGKGFNVTNKHTAGLEVAGEPIEDPERWCKALAEYDDYYEMVQGLHELANEEERAALYELLDVYDGNCFTNQRLLKTEIAGWSENKCETVRGALSTKWPTLFADN